MAHSIGRLSGLRHLVLGSRSDDRDFVNRGYVKQSFEGVGDLRIGIASLPELRYLLVCAGLDDAASDGRRSGQLFLTRIPARTETHWLSDVKAVDAEFEHARAVSFENEL